MNSIIRENKKINNLVIKAFFLRLIVCLLVLFIGTYWFDEIYFISDDVQYEALARAYMSRASNPIDLNALNDIGATGYLQVFWPYVICIVAYCFNCVYAGRFLNILLSSIAVKLIFDLTNLLSNNSQTALKAARLYAYLPYPVLVCCFPIKDIYITMAVLYAFIILVKFQKAEPIKTVQWIVLAVLVIGVYFSRGGVVEVISLFSAMYIIKRFYEQKKYFAILFSFLFIIVVLFFLGDNIIDALVTKADTYGAYALMDTTISAIQMTNPLQLYKLPFTYFFASLQPISMSWFTASSMKIWSRIMYYINLTIVPIACGNFLYVFCKKHNLLFWITTTAMYCGVAALSLGIFRHYLFLFPLILINYALYMEDAGSVRKNNCMIASFSIYMMLLLFSIYRLL